MRFADIIRKITVNDKARARRDSWPPYKQIALGFLLQQRCIVVNDSKDDLHLYTPSTNDIMANDWRLL